MIIQFNLIFFLYFLLVLSSTQSTSQPVTIISATIDLSSTTSLLSGSLKGGATLYIKGTGFDLTAANNLVYIGPYACDLSGKGSSDLFITCDSSQATDPNQLINLPISINVINKKPVSCSTANCAFTYSNSFTPFLYDIVPRSASGNTIINNYGIHRITDLGDGRSPSVGDVKAFLIGNSICSMIDINQGPLNYNNDFEYIKCNVSYVQSAGEYLYQQRVLYGLAKNSSRLFQTSYFSSNVFHFRVIPNITSIDYQIGGTAGRIINIYGTGFNPNLQNYTCSIAGLNCSILKSDLNKVQIFVPIQNSNNIDFGRMQTDPTNPNPQVGGYINGGGLNYIRYDTSSFTNYNLSEWITIIKSGVSLPPIIQKGFRTQFQTPNIYQSYFVEHYSGYFYSPVAGDYKFSLLSQDSSIVNYIPYANTSDLTLLQPLVSINLSTSSIKNYYTFNSTTQFNTVTLNQGYYYIEAYTQNVNQAGFFSLSIQIPNNTADVANPVWQIQQLTCIPTQSDPQILQLIIVATSGTFTLSYILDGSVITSSSIIYNANIGQITAAFGSIPCFSYTYNRTVVITPFDGGYKWTITFYNYRKNCNNIVPTIKTSNLGGLTRATFIQIQAHSPPLSGYYQLVFNNLPIYIKNSLNIPYNTAPYDLQAAIRNSTNYTEIEVDQYPSQNCEDQINMFITLVGFKGPQTLIQLFSQNLTGGRAGTLPAAYVFQLRPGNYNFFYQAIPYQFLFIPSDQPSLRLTVNNITSACLDCSYSIIQASTPILTSYSIVHNTLKLSLSDPAGIGFTSSDITIQFFRQYCINIGGPINNIKCDYPQNADESIALQAGSGVPIVHINQIGFAKTSTVVPTLISMTVSGINPSVGSVAGGLIATITGTGFPIFSSQSLFVTICAINATILSFNNQKIIIRTPSQGDCTLNPQNFVNFNGQSKPFVFTYDPTLTPIITSISKSSSSPILKSDICIYGSGFQTISNTHVYFLQNKVQIYQLNILNITSTSICAILSGGRTGQYTVTVFVQNIGYNTINTLNVDQFYYQIYINSINPTSGPLGGGNNITITGLNFIPDISSNLVFIGDAVNKLCIVYSATTTQIKCTAPRADPSYSSPVIVTVTQRIVEESICSGTCSYFYDITLTNTVSPLSTITYSAGQIIYINGIGLSSASVTIGGIDCPVLVSNDTDISVNFPPLPVGTYQIFIFAGLGYTTPQLLVNTPFYGINYEVYTGSLNGNIIKYTGNGFTNNINDPLLNVYFTCSGKTIPIKIVTAKPTYTSFLVPPSTNNNNCVLNYTYGNFYVTAKYVATANLTPTLNITPTIISNNLNVVFNLKKTSFPYGAAISWMNLTYLDINSNPTNSTYTSTLTQINSTNSQGSLPYLPVGNYQAVVFSEGYGFVTVNSLIKSSFTNLQTNQINSSFGGGGLMTINGVGFQTINIQNNIIQVCGFQTKIVSATTSNATFIVPPLVTFTSQFTYNLIQSQIISGTPMADTIVNANLAFDNTYSTYYTSSNINCYIGYDFGSTIVVNITQLNFMPNPNWLNSALMINGATFQGSNNNLTWNVLYTVDSTVHAGWNHYKPTNWATNYRYLRLKHNSTSKCQFSEIQFQGILYYSNDNPLLQDVICDINVIDTSTAQPVVLPAKVTFTKNITSYITHISPSFGPSVGATTLNITGVNFGTTVSVTIDGITCQILNSNSTFIQCLTGLRPAPPISNSFIVNSDNNLVITSDYIFQYIDRWSQISTWGGQAPPRAGDSVYVPPGMVLYVDNSTQLLFSVMVEGTIMFSDQRDMTFDCYYLVINNGKFIAGTQSKPYTHKLIFTLYGNHQDKQLPTFGNKVIACECCVFEMHGIPRYPTWTQINQTINIGDTSLVLNQPVDWNVGQLISIAATSFNNYQAENKTIISKSTDNKTLVIDSPFIFRHIAVIQTYGNDVFPMRAEVALLTRNIVVRGDPTSINNKYGAHLMLHGPSRLGFSARIQYSQFTICGQPRIIGRYCIHYHLNGQAANSYVRGNSVHHSYARILTLHGVHFLLVELNVGYHVQGHNFFIEDGIETNNVIQDNLAMQSITSWTMLQSDITVASYWITNPFNTVVRNRAAGSDFYGFWYQLKQHPDGPEATSDICPMGMPLGPSQDNIAHSNFRFGLRIFKLSARTYPCQPMTNQSLLNPYNNPSIQSVFLNYTLWKNRECGFLGQFLGNTVIQDFKTVDSVVSGLQFHVTNDSYEFVQARNILIVGFSANNPPANIDTTYLNTRGLITPRSDGFKATNIRFYNFRATMTPLQSCSVCNNYKLWVVGAKTTYFAQISYTNITGNYIFWQHWRREIYIDMDGTLTAPIYNIVTPGITHNGGSVTPYRPSLMIPNHCYQIGNSWNYSVYCDQTITLRSILFTNAVPSSSFNGINIKSYRYNSTMLLSNDLSNFSSQYMVKIKSFDIQYSWAMPFAVGYYYNIHWYTGIDFTHMAIAPTRYWLNNESVILRFNYSAPRQLYQIAKWYQANLQLPYMNESVLNTLDPTTCQNGDYQLDRLNKNLDICISGRNKTIREWIDVNAIGCLNYCSTNIASVGNQHFFRVWSNASQWPNGVLPVAGDNVTIIQGWNLLMDIDPPALNYLEVNGDLIFDQTRNNLLIANAIWVRAGRILIGNATNPFPYKATIQLNGNINSDYILIDKDASGNKLLAVTGGLQFYGINPATIWTKLTAIAPIGTNQISVLNSTGWKVGDSIVIGPSYAGTTQYQNATIVSINGNIITLNIQLKYEHYGDTNPTIVNNYGTLDTRSAVGLLSRNVKIIQGYDPNNWGCRILVYSMLDGSVQRTGYVKFNSVQVNGCGQYNTLYAGISFQKVGYNFVSNRSIISNSSIHDCNGYCMYISNVKNLTINNNVIYWAKKFLVYAQNITIYQFTNNLLIGAKNRPDLVAIFTQTKMYDDIACYQQYTDVNYLIDNINVSNNLCQGSDSEGFVFPHVNCDQLNINAFVNNTAGSCQIGFIFNRLNTVTDTTCIAASRAFGYSNNLGILANAPGNLSRMIYQYMMFADCSRAVTFRYGHQSYDNNMIFRNSYIAGYSRPNCKTCYSDQTISYCKDAHAIRLFISTIGAEWFPLLQLQAFGYDVICNQEAFDAKTFITNVTFQNFRFNSSDQPYCSGMSIFRKHAQASDGISSTHLNKTYCLNCQPKAWARFDAPNPVWIGWSGGCGSMPCTGSNNYFIFDQDGSFLGFRGQLLANNSWIGNNLPACTFDSDINGHICHLDTLAVLQYQSIAPDYNKRIMWPVFLNYSGGNWTSITNGWRQWNWIGPEPLNTRMARFWSVVQLYKKYNLTYSSSPPTDTIFQIQKRANPYGNQSDWLIITIQYDTPNNIDVLYSNTSGVDILMKPNVIKNGLGIDLTTQTDNCGAHNYFYLQNKIQFLVNGKNNCQVRIRLSNNIQMSVRLDIPISNFYSNNGLTSFLTNMVAFLNIDPGRIKIVGVRNGSTIIDGTVTSKTIPYYSVAPNITTNETQQLEQLTNIITQIQNGVNSGTLDLGAPVLDLSLQLILLNNGSGSGSALSKVNYQILIIVLSLTIPTIIIIAGYSIYQYTKKRRQITIIHPQQVLEQKKIESNEVGSDFLSHHVVKKEQRF